MTRAGAVALAATAVLLVGIAVAVSLVRGGHDEASPLTPSAPAATAPTPSPAPAHRVASAAIPRVVSGYRIAAVGQRSYRLSLVFRLRNTLLNGLSAPTSAYSVTTSTARRGAITALLIGVSATPGASPPDIPAEVEQLIGLAPTTRERVDGVGLTALRAPAYGIGLVDAGARRAIVVIAPHTRQALALGRALAQAIARE